MGPAWTRGEIERPQGEKTWAVRRCPSTLKSSSNVWAWTSKATQWYVGWYVPLHLRLLRLWSQLIAALTHIIRTQ